MRNFLEITDISIKQLRMILKDSIHLKKLRIGSYKGVMDSEPVLSDMIVALLFKKPSTRTRFSFEVGIAQMGGKSISVSSKEMQLSNSEKMSDTSRVLSNYVDLIVLRTDSHQDLIELAENSEVPVINGLTDFSHPCQVLSDIFTFEEIVGTIRGKKVVWLGDGNNVCNSYLQSAAKFDFEFVYSGPKLFEPNNTRDLSNFAFEIDPGKAVKDADLLVTDTWFSMHQNQEERNERARFMKDYCITQSLIKIAKPGCLIFHCMPLYREKEISTDIADDFFQIFLAQAENRLHVQKGIIKWCLS